LRRERFTTRRTRRKDRSRWLTFSLVVVDGMFVLLAVGLVMTFDYFDLLLCNLNWENPWLKASKWKVLQF